MNRFSESAKLDILRAKTDQELIAIIHHGLERGLQTVGENRAEAERAHAEAVKLLPVVRDLSGAERRRLEIKLAELHAALEMETQAARQHV